MGFVRRIALLAALAVCLLPTAQAAAAVRVFPGCGATLAACIHSSPAGTTISLRTNSLIAIPDNFAVAKGLSFVAAPGFKPRIGRTTPTTQFSFQIAGPKMATVSFRGIRFVQVGVSAFFGSGTGHRFVFERNLMGLNSGSNGGQGVSVYYGSTGRGSITIKRNGISSSGYAIEVSPKGGPVAITGNRLTAPVATDSGGSIALYSSGSGTVRATVANNLIHHSGQCACGSPGGIRVRAFETATLDLRLLNNTLDHLFKDSTSGTYGIRITNGDPGAHINARIYNNSVSTVRFGINVTDDPTIEATGNLNNTFDVESDNFSPYDLGTTTHVDPMYVDAASANYRLQSSSPLVNAGQTCIAGLPLPRADAAYLFRLVGRAVDVGAYERGSMSSGGVQGISRSGTDLANTLGGSPGRDILCGLDGPDTLRAYGGGDFLFGGAGGDHAYGGDGADLLDLQDGVAGNDHAFGGPGRDRCFTDAQDTRASCP